MPASVPNCGIDNRLLGYEERLIMHARFVVWMISIAVMVLGVGAVHGQNYPNKPIRIVTSEIGGSSDFMARVIAQGISGPLGQPVITDNRGGGVIPGEIVAKASPDGYTLLFIGSSFWLLPLMRDKVPYDPVRDFSPITLASNQPNVLVVHPSVAAKSVRELISLAKDSTGVLNYGSGGAGTSAHLAAELFKSMAGVNIMRIPYKGQGPAINDLLGGRLQLIFASAPVAAYVKAGRLRALAVTSAQPTALFPELPTVAAAGLPGYESAQLAGIFASAKVPARIINRLSQEAARFLRTAEAKQAFLNSGIEAVGSSPEEFAAKIKSEMARLGKLIKDVGIRDE